MLSITSFNWDFIAIVILQEVGEELIYRLNLNLEEQCVSFSLVLHLCPARECYRWYSLQDLENSQVHPIDCFQQALRRGIALIFPERRISNFL